MHESAIYYFPSCTFTRLMPETSGRIKAFLAAKGVTVMGCCRPGHRQITGKALTICQTCRIIIDENRPDTGCRSVWEYLDQIDFPFPDYQGQAMTIQDCYRAREHDSEKAAVRRLMRKMNIRVIELDGTKEEVNFDGAWLFSPVKSANSRIAPHRFSAIEKDIRILPDEEIKNYLGNYCLRYQTEKVVCYCNSCWTGLKENLPEGKEALHIAQLMFPDT